MEGLRPTLYVPMRAFALATRDLGSQGGANLVGVIKPQDIGVLGWSALVRSGSPRPGPPRGNHFGSSPARLPPSAFTGGSVVGLPATETSRGHDIRHSRALEIDNQVIGPQCCSPPAGYLIPTKIMFGTSQESLTG